jgi:hypothetical protein
MVHPNTNMTMNTFTPLASATLPVRLRAHIGTNTTATLSMVVKMTSMIQDCIYQSILYIDNDQDDINTYTDVITAYTSLVLSANMEVSMS